MPWTDLKIAERVKAGAEFLDKRIPGWRAKVNLEDLSINSACNCVLGQVWPLDDIDHCLSRTGYNAAKRDTGIDGYGAARLGFNMLNLYSTGGYILSPVHQDRNALEEEVRLLEEAWKAEVQQGNTQ